MTHKLNSMQPEYTQLQLLELYDLIAEKTVILNDMILYGKFGEKYESIRKEVEVLQLLIEQKRKLKEN